VGDLKRPALLIVGGNWFGSVDGEVYCPIGVRMLLRVRKQDALRFDAVIDGLLALQEGGRRSYPDCLGSFGVDNEDLTMDA
jgi:hypothetical protein